MNDNTKIEVAREVMNAMIGSACKNGFDKNSKKLKLLLKEEQEMRNFNSQVIDKILYVYAPMIKEGRL